MSKLAIFVAALGLAMFLEGLPYFVSPRGVRRYLGQLQQLSDPTLRLMGFALMAAGLVVAYLAFN